MQKAFATTLAVLCLWLPARSQQQTIDQLDRYIRPISQLQADSSFADLEFLGETLKGKTIIGLGEATHGTKEIFAYKDKLIRFMVERLGHRTIAFEADHAGLQSVDDYINGKTDQVPMSVHYRPLFDWLRAFNKTISTKEKVHLYGLEMRSFAPAISRLLTRYPDIAIADRKLFERIAAARFDRIDAPSLSEFRSAVGRLPEDLERIMLLQLIGNYRDFISLDSKIGVRDRFMATNANAIIKAGADGKLIIWAHNGHVAKTSLYRVPAMGQYLSNQHGNSYYVIATDINQGKVSVRIAPGKDRPLSDWQGLYYPPVSDSKGYEYYFSKCRYKNFILEFNEASVQPLLRDFLRRPKEMRMIGGLSTPVNKKLSMSDNFDMLVYFDTSSSL